MKDDRIIIRIEKKQKERLEQLAKKSRREFSDYIRLVLADAVIKNKKV